MSAMVVIPAPKIPCFRCKKSHDTPAAFLVACVKCERAWHHTCHIPRVTENEIQDRISADKTGKREAGLGSWQCRTCTKRSRVEPSIASTAQPCRPATRTPFLSQPPGAAHAHVQDAIKAQPRAVPIVISDDDDDIVMLDEPPEQVRQPEAAPAKVSGPAAALLRTRPVWEADSKAKASTVPVSGSSSIERAKVSSPLPHITAPPLPSDQVAQLALAALPVNNRPTPKGKERAFAPTGSSLAHGSIAEESLPAITSSKNTDKAKDQDLPRLAKRARARNPLVVSPVYAAQQEAWGDPGSSSQPTLPLPLPVRARPPGPKLAPPLPVAPPTILQRTMSALTDIDARPSSPHLSSGVASSAAIRALIAKMREQGRLAPPPTIEWVQTRGTDAARKKQFHRRVSSLHEAVAAVSTGSDFASGEELRTSTDAEESMEVDAQLSAPEPVPQSGSEPELEADTEPDAQPKLKLEDEDEEDDPHNIDDLYGDIALRFCERPVNVRALYVGREQRTPRKDDLEMVFDKLARIEQQRGAAARRPRKSFAKKLTGKELKKKQESGMNYLSVHD